ncbi:MAG: hypothetical protein AB7O24_01075 [Kofleriaceae bacterium]
MVLDRLVIVIAKVMTSSALLASCGRGVPPSRIDQAIFELPDSWLHCARDADCIALELGCCDRCNGGWVLATNRDHADRARELYHTPCDPYPEFTDDGSIVVCTTSCTEKACNPTRAVCDEGQCTWALEQDDGSHQLGSNVVDRIRLVPDRSSPICTAPLPGCQRSLPMMFR